MFSVRGSIVNVSGFSGYMISLATTAPYAFSFSGWLSNSSNIQQINIENPSLMLAYGELM